MPAMPNFIPLQINTKSNPAGSFLFPPPVKGGETEKLNASLPKKLNLIMENWKTERGKWCG
mgnify:CR=1 FL=1